MKVPRVRMAQVAMEFGRSGSREGIEGKGREGGEEEMRGRTSQRMEVVQQARTHALV